MKITLSLEEAGDSSTCIEIEAQPNQLIRSVADRAAQVLDTDVEEVLECLAEIRAHDSGKASVADFVRDGRQTFRLRLVCIKLHFEGESRLHRFQASRTWSAVHRWACKKFNVADDACPNLQLRDGSSEGSLINENQKIGEFHGCKNVWLVAPGPEQNGR